MKSLSLLIICWTIFVCVGYPQQGCPDRCDCEKFDYWEVQCPRLEYRVKVDYRDYDPYNDRREYAKLQCESTKQDVYNYIPKLNLGEITMFKIQSCPLPPVGHSFASILQKMNVTKVRFLAYQAFQHQDNPLFRRQHFAGFKDMQKLLISDNSQNELPDDMFDELTSLNWLQLKSTRDHLPQGIFSKLTNLQALELAMKLHTIEPGQFTNLDNLKSLSLWGNQLHNLTKDSFKDVPNVTELDLSANNIETLDAEVFSHLHQLQMLNLNANNFTALPGQLFVNNTELIEVKLANNRQELTELPAGLFAHLKQLKKLYIRADISVLPEDLLAGSSNITHLFLEHNRLQSLPAKLLHDQTNLTELNLAYNQLEHLDDNIFRNTRALRILRLTNNSLTMISDNLFGTLNNLQELYLDHNALHTISNNAFFGTDSLERLELQYNSLSLKAESFLTGLPDKYEIDVQHKSFNRLSKLKYLLLQHNKVESILEDWTLTNLELQELDLSYNEIRRISATSLQFIQPKIVVNLTNNKISTVDFSDLNPFDTRSELAKIYLGQNPLNCDCQILNFVLYLRNADRKTMDLDISGLNCERPERMKGHSVTYVDKRELLCPLDSPSTNHCPRECTCMVRPVDLTILVNCSNANLTAVPRLPSPGELKLRTIELDVSNNFIVELPSITEGGYNNVSELVVEGNNLSKLGVENIPEQIRVLKLKGNLLESINTTVLDRLNQTKTLKKLTLSANDWICDCSTVGFLSFVQTHFRKIGDLANIQCAGGGELSRMQPGSFCPENNLPVILASIMLALFGILVGLGTVMYMKYNQEIKVWLFAKGWCMWLISEDELDEDKKYDAFISFSQRDEELVAEYLVPELESGEFPYKLCIHSRDWMVGDMIYEQVRRSVQESRKTIVILSKHFLESNWGKHEFREAHQTALKEGRARVILIIFGDIGDMDQLPEDFQAYTKTNTYLVWGDQWFWRKLRYALRHPISLRSSSAGRGLIKNAIKNSVDDKLELIIPSPVTPTLTTPPAECANNSIIKKLSNGHPNGTVGYTANGKVPNGINGHVNGAFIINTNAKQSDV